MDSSSSSLVTSKYFNNNNNTSNTFLESLAQLTINNNTDVNIPPDTHTDIHRDKNAENESYSDNDHNNM